MVVRQNKLVFIPGQLVKYFQVKQEIALIEHLSSPPHQGYVYWAWKIPVKNILTYFALPSVRKRSNKFYCSGYLFLSNKVGAYPSGGTPGGLLVLPANIWPKKLAKYNHSSLFCLLDSDEEESLVRLTPVLIRIYSSRWVGAARRRSDLRRFWRASLQVWAPKRRCRRRQWLPALWRDTSSKSSGSRDESEWND